MQGESHSRTQSPSYARSTERDEGVRRALGTRMGESLQQINFCVLNPSGQMSVDSACLLNQVHSRGGTDIF